MLFSHLFFPIYFVYTYIKALLSFTLLGGILLDYFNLVTTNTCAKYTGLVALVVCRHNCLWCTIPSSKLAEPPSKRTPFPLRSLESLAEDHRKFLTQGKGNLKVAKLYNNVISDTLFDIPLTNVR